MSDAISTAAGIPMGTFAVYTVIESSAGGLVTHYLVLANTVK